MHEVLVNRFGGLSLPRKSVVRLTDRPDMTLDVYRGRKTTMQQQQQLSEIILQIILVFPNTDTSKTTLSITHIRVVWTHILYFPNISTFLISNNRYLKVNFLVICDISCLHRRRKV